MTAQQPRHPSAAVHTGPVASVEVALKHAVHLLEAQPPLAAEQAREILTAAPGLPMARWLQAAAWRRLGEPARAAEQLEALIREHADWPAALLERALCRSALGEGGAALAELRRVVQLDPRLSDAWRALGDHLSAIGDATGADQAYLRQIQAAAGDPRLRRAALALGGHQIPVAEALLREHLKVHPTDVAAIRMFAEVAARLGRYRDAALLLERALELAPSFLAARKNYALVLHRQTRAAEALREVDTLLGAEPGNPGHRNLKAVILGTIGRYEESIALYEQLLQEYPGQPKLWLSYGHVLKTAGRSREGVQAYRRALALDPGEAEAYWSLANLKTFRFDAADEAAMRIQRARADLPAASHCFIEFALGKAEEDAGRYAAAFAHYEAANRLRRTEVPYQAEDLRGLVRRTRARLDRRFFAERSGHGSPAADPIFIVGLPRAGSTLIEQILASHPQVEGTLELPDLISMARGLSSLRPEAADTAFPEVLFELSAQQCRALGEEYLNRTRIYRRTGAPRFIDKLPNNFAHIALIQLILPNARIIDARRHPLGCCFSAFKQYFARGQSFSYGLEDLGHYYRDYVALMAHFDAVLPGRVHRVHYEALVDDMETQVRALLAYCGLAYDDRCLRYFENERAVRTASSEQVRQPIYREGLDHWRHFEAFLSPLKAALGPVLASYPQVPAIESDAKDLDAER